MDFLTGLLKNKDEDYRGHHIKFRGLAGSVFMTLAASAFFYAISMASGKWAAGKIGDLTLWYGLFSQCNCTSTFDKMHSSKWFYAVQICSISLMCSQVLALLLMSIYLCSRTRLVHIISYTTLSVLGIATFLNMINVIIYGVMTTESFYYGYYAALISFILLLTSFSLGYYQNYRSQKRLEAEEAADRMAAALFPPEGDDKDAATPENQLKPSPQTTPIPPLEPEATQSPTRSNYRTQKKQEAEEAVDRMAAALWPPEDDDKEAATATNQWKPSPQTTSIPPLEPEATQRPTRSKSITFK